MEEVPQSFSWHCQFEKEASVFNQGPKFIPKYKLIKIKKFEALGKFFFSKKSIYEAFATIFFCNLIAPNLGMEESLFF